VTIGRNIAEHGNAKNAKNSPFHSHKKCPSISQTITKEGVHHFTCQMPKQKGKNTDAQQKGEYWVIVENILL
jgi:hypothetical protein